MSNNLRIDKPCPFVPSFMNKEGDNFYCKSCSRTIIDFRGKTPDEVQCLAGKNICGVFTLDQLPGQRSFTFSRRVLFYTLSLLSVLGFSVRPLSAQTNQNKKDTISIANKPEPDEGKMVRKQAVKDKRSKHKNSRFFRKRKETAIGCPDF